MSPVVSFDQIFTERIHAFGRWQLFLFITVTLSSIPPLILFPQLAFLVPPYRCAQPQLSIDEWSSENNYTITLPPGETVNAQCHQYNDSAQPVGNITPPVIPCLHGWTFDREKAPFRNSFTEHFQLICARKYYIPLLSMAFMIGMTFGYPVGGFLGDRFGRRPVFLISSLLSFLASLGAGLSVSIWMFFAFRIAVGALTSVANVAGYVLCAEVTNAKHRNSFNNIFHLINDFLCGYAVLIAFLTQDWRLYHIIASVFCLLALPLTFIVPESPRWLVCRNRVDRAQQVLKTAARINGRKLLCPSVEELGSLQHDETDKGSKTRWYSIFTQASVRRTTLALSVIWFCTVHNYYGLGFYAVRLRGNPYAIAAVAGLMGLPAGIIKYFLYRHFDRRRPLLGMLVFGAIASGSAVLTQVLDISPIAEIVFATIAIGAAVCVFMMLFTLTPECFLTTQRTFATGYLSGFSRIGSMCAMLVERLDELVWSPLPMIIFFSAFVLSATMIPLLECKSDCTEMTLETETKQEEGTSITVVTRPVGNVGNLPGAVAEISGGGGCIPESSPSDRH